jgi:hypothetical protein
MATNSIGFPAVALTYVVANWVVPLPFVHCTTEQGRIFVPVTVSVAPEAPAVAVAGKTAAMDGAGGVEAEIVKGTELERALELDTSIWTAPEVAMSEAGTMAVSCVALTKVVANVDGRAGGGFTAHLTTEPLTKFVPVTVSVTFEGPHDGVVFDEVVDDDTEVTVGGEIVNGIFDDVDPSGFNRTIWAVWTTAEPARSLAGTPALSWSGMGGVVIVPGTAGT